MINQEQRNSDSFIPEHQSSGFLMAQTKLTPTGFTPVEQWEVQPFTTRSDGGSTRYAGQLIIQLENDPDIRDGAIRLAEKHPGSVLVQLDQKNHYRVLSGSPKTLQGKLRWQLVGHSSSSKNISSSVPQMSDINPNTLADILKEFNRQFSEQYDINSTPNRISLVGYHLMNEHGENFATQFAHEMKRKGIQTEISARIGRVSVPSYGNGKKFTRKTTSIERAQTAEDTFLLGWTPKGELIRKKHSSAFRLLSPVLNDWAPHNFRDPKKDSKRFKYLVYPASIKDLMSRKRIFSKNIQDKLRQADLISASILSDESLRGYTVGVILEVPEQNILAAAPDKKMIETNLEEVIKKSDLDFSSIKEKGTPKPTQRIDALDEQLTLKPFPYLSELSQISQNGLLSHQLFSYRQRVATPDDIIQKTTMGNTVLITGRPNVNIYPNYPVTKEIKITGLFLISPDPRKNTLGPPSFVSPETISSKNWALLHESAQKIANELDIELKVIKASQSADHTKIHQRNINTEINQVKSANPSNRGHHQKNSDFSNLSLTEKLKQVGILVNDIAYKNWTSFSPNDLTLLKDFFHLPSGEIDWTKLYQTLSDPLMYSQFTSQVQSLIQLSATHAQLMGLTGQSALHRAAHWESFILDNMVNWNEWIKLYNNIPGFCLEVHPSMQAIYIDDGTAITQQKAKKISLAYLSILNLNDRDLRLKLLNASNTHAEINEQKIFSQVAKLNDEYAKNFGRLIHQLKVESSLTKKEPQSLYQFFKTLAGETTGYYQLHIGEHILTIAKHYIQNRQTNWYLYDPNFGEISTTSEHVQRTAYTLRLMLNDYFTRLGNLPKKNGLFLFDVYQFNPAKLFKSPPFKKLKEFIRDADRSLPLLSTDEAVTVHKNTDRNSQSFKLSRTVNLLGQTNQGVSWIQYVTFLSNYWRRYSSEQLSESQKQVLNFEVKLATLGFAYDMGSTFLELGLREMGSRIMAKFSSQSLILASKMRRFQYISGLSLARYGGAVLNIFGAGFDIYQIYRSATELETVTEPDLRQDLKVSIALSFLGAAISISMGALGLLALSGKIASAASLIGITLGVAIAIVGGVYSSFRQIQEIERYTKLTTLQKLRTGWLSFWGAEIDADVTNQITKKQAEIRAQENFEQQFKANFQTLLDSDNQTEAVYYSIGKILLKEYPYKTLTGKKWINLTRLGRRYSLVKNIKDKILPSEAKATLAAYQEKKTVNEHLYVNLTLEDSEYKFYDIKGLAPTDDQIFLNTDTYSESTFFLKRSTPSSSGLSSPDSTQENASIEIPPTQICFFLGDGNDQVIGHPEKKNLFYIGEGVKNFKGGNQSDTFIFSGTAAPSQPSIFDGVKGFNSLIANKKSLKGGYFVNLEEGVFSFDDSQKIATLKHISHIETCSETDDVIWAILNPTS